MAKASVRQTHNHFGNVGVGLYPELDFDERVGRIGEDLARRRRRGAHPAMRAASRATAAVPAPLLRWGVAQFDPDARSPTATGNTVVSSVNRGAADLHFGDAPVVVTAGYPGLSPMMGLTHGVHGIGDTIAVSVHAAESGSATSTPMWTGWTRRCAASSPRPLAPLGIRNCAHLRQSWGLRRFVVGGQSALSSAEQSEGPVGVEPAPQRQVDPDQCVRLEQPGHHEIAGVDGFEAQLTDQVPGHAFGFLVVAADEHDGLPGNSGWFIIGAPIWFIALHTRARRAWGQGHRRCLRMPRGGHPLAVIGGKMEGRADLPHDAQRHASIRRVAAQDAGDK